MAETPEGGVEKGPVLSIPQLSKNTYAISGKHSMWAQPTLPPREEEGGRAGRLKAALMLVMPIS